jgi:4-hydroxy-3-methylbut-2-enyl diphosphate reductase
VAYLTQTTLSLDETSGIIDRLRQRFPNIQGPHSQDICYATENRQVAVKNIVPRSDLLLVVGSSNSSNSNRLVEVAREHGLKAFLIEDASSIKPEWLNEVSTASVTAGASAPEHLVQQVIEHLEQIGFGAADEVEVIEEDVRFALPAELMGGPSGSAGKLVTL